MGNAGFQPSLGKMRLHRKNKIPSAQMARKHQILSGIRVLSTGKTIPAQLCSLPDGSFRSGKIYRVVGQNDRYEGDKRLFYIDSDGEVDEIIYKDNVFLNFKFEYRNEQSFYNDFV